jgi:hypothetical protein
MAQVAMVVVGDEDGWETIQESSRYLRCKCDFSPGGVVSMPSPFELAYINFSKRGAENTSIEAWEESLFTEGVTREAIVRLRPLHSEITMKYIDERLLAEAPNIRHLYATSDVDRVKISISTTELGKVGIIELGSEKPHPPTITRLAEVPVTCREEKSWSPLERAYFARLAEFPSSLTHNRDTLGRLRYLPHSVQLMLIMNVYCCARVAPIRFEVLGIRRINQQTPVPALVTFPKMFVEGVVTDHFACMTRGALPFLSVRPRLRANVTTTKTVLLGLIFHLINKTGTLLNNRYIPQRALDCGEGKTLATVIAYHIALNSPMSHLPAKPILEYIITNEMPEQWRWESEGISWDDAREMIGFIPPVCHETLCELLPLAEIFDILGFDKFYTCLTGEELILSIPTTMPWMIIHPDMYGLVETFMSVVCGNAGILSGRNKRHLFGDWRSYSGTLADLYPRIEVLPTNGDKMVVRGHTIRLPMSIRNNVKIAKYLTEYIHIVNRSS